jgi:hypothetical protein
MEQDEFGSYHSQAISDATKMANSIMKSLQWDNKGLVFLENLQRKMSASTAEWMEQFLLSFGLEYLTMKMPEPSPFSIEFHYKAVRV